MICRVLPVLLLIVAVSGFCSAQVYSGDKAYYAEAAGMAGGMITFGNYNSKVRNSPVYTISGAYIRNEQIMYELNVNTLFSTITYKSYNGFSDTTTKYSQTYVMFGIVKSFRIENPDLVPFFSTTFGFISRSVQVANVSAQTQLAVGLQGGLKYFIKDNFGIKVQARLQSSLNGLGIGVGVGSGGPSVGLGSYSNAIQLDFSGGIFYRI